MKKILIMGLPSSGKTTLARQLAKRLRAVHWNADDVRANINKDLSFSEADRIEQARRMGWLCDRVVETGQWAIADFICPTPATRKAFGNAWIVWMDTIKESQYEDTNKLFVAPDNYDYRVSEKDAQYWSKYLHEQLDFEEHPSVLKAMLLGMKDVG